MEEGSQCRRNNSIFGNWFILSSYINMSLWKEALSSKWKQTLHCFPEKCRITALQVSPGFGEHLICPTTSLEVSHRDNKWPSQSPDGVLWAPGTKNLTRRKPILSCWQSPPFPCDENNKDNSVYFVPSHWEAPACTGAAVHVWNSAELHEEQLDWAAVCSVKPHCAPKGGVWYRLEHPANLRISASCVFMSMLDVSHLVTQLASIINWCCRQIFWYLEAVVTCTLLQMAVKQQKKSPSISSSALIYVQIKRLLHLQKIPYRGRDWRNYGVSWASMNWSA